MKIVLKITLKTPFGRSYNLLLEMTNLWGSSVVRMNPKMPFQTIAMPYRSFKRIWGVIPKVGKHKIPEGTEDFMAQVEVIKIDASE